MPPFPSLSRLLAIPELGLEKQDAEGTETICIGRFLATPFVAVVSSVFARHNPHCQLINAAASQLEAGVVGIRDGGFMATQRVVKERLLQAVPVTTPSRRGYVYLQTSTWYVVILLCLPRRVLEEG